MARKGTLDYIYVVWQDPESRNNYVIGTLTRNGHYAFSYGVEVEQAKKHGFVPLISFPDLEKTYQDETMFPAFACRLPDPRRRGIEGILKKYDLEQYDEFEFLKKSGARLPTDTLSFVDPIFEDAQEIDRVFFVAGVRHYMKCNGDQCAAVTPLPAGTLLKLERDPLNAYDENAVRIMTEEGEHIGYVPRYYSQAVSERLDLNLDHQCTVVEHAREKQCGECLKVRLQMAGPQRK